MAQKKIENKTILLIGGSGFLGFNTAIRIINSCKKLVVLTRNKTHTQRVFADFKKIEIYEIRLNETEKIKHILEINKINEVIHMASGMLPSSSKEELNQEFVNIIFPTFELFHILARKKIKVLFVSSAGTIYGLHSGQINENTSLNPISYYGFSKLLIEDYILFLSRSAGLKFVIVRPSNVYGNIKKINKQQGFIEIATDKIIRNHVLKIWGNGKQKRDFLYISDFCYLLEEIISRDFDNEIFNVVSGESYTLLQIINILEKELLLKPSLFFSKKREVDINQMEFDRSYLQSKIKFRPTGIEDGIRLYLSKRQ
jgi:UDP-glucose 4-epimerase